ncbi:MAG: hypothetical protein ABSC49_00685 [Candidatus Microgenomates bacterium]|jgi:hypothetical protein
MLNLLAQDNPFGTINAPTSSLSNSSDAGQAIGKIIQYAIWILIVGAGIYALFNFIIAGYDFMSAGDDPKKVAGAWAKIWQTALGLAVAAGALVLAGIFGQLIFGNATYILNPSITPLQLQ